MDIAFGVLLGIGLAAACGFRVFVPPLVLSLAALAGHVHLSPGFQWLGTWPAAAALGAATLIEVLAYYVPWLDNALDVAATPSAVVAGALVATSCADGMSPLLRWTLAAILGAGAAGAVQVVTVKARALSSLFTAGAGNFLVSTAEGISSAVVSLLVVLLPVATLFLLGAVGFVAWRVFRPKGKSGARRTGC